MNDCTICLEKLDTEVTTTSCLHTFHTSCLNEWLVEENICPMCRHEDPLIKPLPLKFWFMRNPELSILMSRIRPPSPPRIRININIADLAKLA